MTVRQSQSFESFSTERHEFIPAPVPTEEEDEFASHPTTGVRQFLEHNKGLFIIAASQLFFSLMELSVKVLTALDDPVSMLEVVAVRMVLTYILCQAYMFAVGVADPILGPKDVRKWLVLRGIFGFTGLFGLYYSLQFMSLSDATVLTFLSPTVTAAFGFFFLREAVSWKQGVAGLVSLSGVVLIVKPTFLFGGSHRADTGTGAEGPAVTEAQRMVAVGFALFGVLGAACAYVTIRIIGKRAHPMHMMSYYAIWSVLVSVVAMFSTNTQWILPSQLAWSVMLIIVGIFGFCAQLLLTFGLQLETASRGSMLFYIQIVFALIFERIVFGETPSSLSLVGICVIMASAVYVALNKPPTRSSGPSNPASLAVWDVAPASEEGRALLDEYEQANNGQDDQKDITGDEQRERNIAERDHSSEELEGGTVTHGPMCNRSGSSRE